MPSRTATDKNESANDNNSNGTKRKADDAVDSSALNESNQSQERAPKQQKTLEETISNPVNDDKTVESNHEASELKADKIDTGEEKRLETDQQNASNHDDEHTRANQQRDQETSDKPALNGKETSIPPKKETDADGDDKMIESGTDKNGTKQQSNGAASGAVEEDKRREAAQPSNLLEKGIIYFFLRGRVGIKDPDSVQDVARSYFVLRPLAPGAKITGGSIQDIGNNRLVALPKKVWPKSGKDRFMAFVEKAKVDMATLKTEFFSGSEYSTQTSGTRQTPEVTPLGEGVYAMTSTGGGQGTTHLAYMLTIPRNPGQVQSDVGLSEKGSFVLSLKNPEAPGPSYAQLPEGPGYPKEFIDEFHGRGWMPVAPKHLDYANAQMLLIGEDFQSSNNLEAAAKDESKSEKETPQEELEKLEDEDEHRVEHLSGNDTIFDDLGISSKEYPEVMTTW